MIGDEESQQEITLDNVFDLITRHQQFKQTYSKSLTQEIDFLSSHFYELDESKREQLKGLPLWMIEKVINNPKLRLFEEDQLLTFINDLYLKKSDYSFLYEFVIFQNINDPSSIKVFAEIFNANDMTRETWNSITKRLQLSIVASEKVEIERYIEPPKKCRLFTYGNNNEFDGIMNFLVNESNGNVDDAITITSSSSCGSNYCPQNAVIYDDDVNFQSDRDEKPWICFDFKEHRVIPSDYLIKSFDYEPGSNHPKTWIIEGSNDNESWDTLDRQENCPYLNGNHLVHSFKIQNNQDKEYKYIRMVHTGKTWNNNTFLRFESFEIFGSLI